MQATFVALLALVPFCLCLAPLEPPTGKVLIGAWYDRNNSDTPKAINDRLGKNLNFFQTDIDLSGVHKPWTAPIITEQFIQQLQDTKTDANAYLTLYPFLGFDAIKDSQLDQMVVYFKALIAAGRSVFVRFAPEMNGSWFPYGQRPEEFKKSWIYCINYWRKELGDDKSKVAFIWAPNSGNGYPFPKDPESKDEFYGPDLTTPEGRLRMQQMDTNGNGGLDQDDDPYLPYYPGDAYVDWVGLSIYTYANVYPWTSNVIPSPRKFEGMLQGLTPDAPEQVWGNKPFYTYFSSATGSPGYSAGSKPFIVAETGAAYHFAWKNSSLPGAPDQTITRAQMKKAWWESFLDQAFIAKYPMFKAVCTFEFVKSEEETWRDFTNFGGAPGSDAFKSASQDVANAFRADADANMTSFLVFAQSTASQSGVATITKSSAVPQIQFTLFALISILLAI